MWPMGGDFNAETNYGLLRFGQNLQDTRMLYNKLIKSSSVNSTWIKSRLAKISSYATYYGNDPKAIANLKLFNLAIVQPQLSKTQLEQLHRAKTKTIVKTVRKQIF